MEWVDIEKEHPYHWQKVKVKGKFSWEAICRFWKTEKGYRFVTDSISCRSYEIYGITHWSPYGMD